ncbi:ATP-binding protein [Salmonella enterica subsp. enterica]|uniref:ATP-binding protein n=1 Tax=Salmonella enterica I TaxID=59201 RepID=A0A447TXC4_SALET|nr:ATP-binding protein [Salmonella enterica subsp. enterica]
MEDGTESVEGQIIGLDVEKMSFPLTDNGNRILNEISFSIHAGETVAVVGASGSGKSTLLMLLARFFTIPPPAGCGSTPLRVNRIFAT